MELRSNSHPECSDKLTHPFITSCPGLTSLNPYCVPLIGLRCSNSDSVYVNGRGTASCTTSAPALEWDNEQCHLNEALARGEQHAAYRKCYDDETLLTSIIQPQMLVTSMRSASLRLVQWIVVFGRALHITKRDFTVGDMQSVYNQMNSEVTLQMQICRCFVNACVHHAATRHHPARRHYPRHS